MRRSLVGRYDILGDDRLVIGDAVDEIMAIAGDDDGGSGLTSDEKKQIIQRVMAKNALIVKDSKPTHARRFPLGFVSNGTILAGDSATITSRPQVLFKGERLVVPSDVAGDFVIDDVKVGKDSQFVAEGAIPARVLQENAVDVYFELDTAQISQDISISVTNIGGAPRTFRAALIGKAAE